LLSFLDNPRLTNIWVSEGVNKTFLCGPHNFVSLSYVIITVLHTDIERDILTKYDLPKKNGIVEQATRTLLGDPH
jgi:hypothetical protein